MIRIRAIRFTAPPPALSPARSADSPLKIQRAEEHTGAGDHPLGTPRGWGATPEPTGSLIRDASVSGASIGSPVGYVRLFGVDHGISIERLTAVWRSFHSDSSKALFTSESG
jgi:hypothetical protein